MTSQLQCDAAAQWPAGVACLRQSCHHTTLIKWWHTHMGVTLKHAQSHCVWHTHTDEEACLQAHTHTHTHTHTDRKSGKRIQTQKSGPEPGPHPNPTQADWNMNTDLWLLLWNLISLFPYVKIDRYPAFNSANFQLPSVTSDLFFPV